MTHELSREQFCTMILYDWKIGLNYKESHARSVATWGAQAPSDRTVLNWFYEYERGKLDVSDSPRSGGLQSAVTDEMIAAIQLMIDEDPHVTYQQIEDSLGGQFAGIFFNPARSLRVTQGLRSMGTTFTHQRPKMTPSSVLSRISETI